MAKANRQKKVERLPSIGRIPFDSESINISKFEASNFVFRFENLNFDFVVTVAIIEFLDRLRYGTSQVVHVMSVDVAHYDPTSFWQVDVIHIEQVLALVS